MDLLIIVALAKVPQANLVKVVQSKATGDGIEEVRVLDGDGDDLGNVELEEPSVAQDGSVLDVAYENEDEEWDRDEIEDCGHDGGVATGVGSGHCAGSRSRRPWSLGGGVLNVCSSEIWRYRVVRVCMKGEVGYV